MIIVSYGGIIVNYKSLAKAMMSHRLATVGALCYNTDIDRRR